jgi:hypothetical protein
MSEPCKFEDKIIKIGEDVAFMRSDLANAIKSTAEHINAGSKWRMAIVVASLGLVGGIVGAIVRFSVIDFKVSMHDTDIKEIRGQIYDLNYEKGRAVGLAEKEDG